MARRKKNVFDTLGKHIWNFPLKSFVVFFMGVNVSMFLVHRIIMFVDFYHMENASFKDDHFVNENICKNDNLKANLGSNYVDICHRAEIDSQKWVLMNAFRMTIQNTYLCGDEPCMELFERLMEIVTRSLAWTVCAVLIGMIIILCLLVYFVGACGGGGRRWNKSKVRYIDLEEQVDEMQQYREPLRIVYENYDDFKKKI